MKILQVIPYFCFGGAETLCENLTYALRALGHEVTVVSLYNERTPIAQRMEQAGVSIRYLDKKLGLDVSMVPKLRKIFREEKPDVVHTHLDVIKYAALAARLAGVPRCVHTVHNLAEEEAEGPVQKFINGTYFHLGLAVPVALTEKIAASIAEFYGREPENIPVVGNGINLSGCLVKESYRLPERPTILHVGRFNEQKNHPSLLRSFRRVHDAHPECRLLLLGDGEDEIIIKAMAREMGLGEAVIFGGVQTNVYPFYHDADIFTLPSRYEGMPMTILEAMATGLPIAATAVGGVPDMLEDNVSGLLVPCREEAVADALIRLLEDEDLRTRLGRQARADSARYSSLEMARGYVEVYQRVN